MPRFERARKRWEIDAVGPQLIIRSDGKTERKQCADAFAARLEMARLIGDKEREGYREATPELADGEPVASLADELAALDAALAGTVQPYVRIVATPREALTLWESKACDGRPYLPRDTAWPSVDGERLLPVLQIALAAVPALPGFPRSGMLSLFWAADYSTTRLLYFPELVRDPAQLWSDFPSFDTLYPYDMPTALAFERREGSVCLSDYRFAELVGEELEDALFDSPHYDKLGAHVIERSGSVDSRIGGYASPQQEDPRCAQPAYATHLLQLQNDNFTHNIFIKPADLARADFADLLYYEACD